MKSTLHVKFQPNYFNTVQKEAGDSKSEGTISELHYQFSYSSWVIVGKL